jgi:hypothetical protein
MKALRLPLAVFAAAIALFSFAAPAQAGGGWHGDGGNHWRGGVYLNFGVPFPYYWGPRYYYGPPVYYAAPPAYYYGAPAVVAPSSPPVYVERYDSVPAAPQSQPPATWWYWCASANGYFPYVKECPGGWQRVPPQQ